MEKEQPIWKKAFKIWTYVSIPLEAILLTHGIIYRNVVEVAVGGGGLVLDYFTLKWLDRNKNKQNLTLASQENPLTLVSKSGSERLKYHPA